jgi:putative phosphoribosyl transferase
VRKSVTIDLADVVLQGDLTVPAEANGLVIFAHGSGSSRHSPRNRYVAGRINAVGVGTLLMDLLTVEEERIDEFTREIRFNIPLLADRVAQVVDWVGSHAELSGFVIGLFGSSTGAAAALIAAAELPPDAIRTVVSRGGRPDLADRFLPRVKCPTLLIVGGDDIEVLALNEQAQKRMTCEAKLSIIPGATHLFEEPGCLEMVAVVAADWFKNKLSFVKK